MYIHAVDGVPKRLGFVLALLSISLLILTFYRSDARQRLHSLPQHIGLGEWSDPAALGAPDEPSSAKSRPVFQPGVAKPLGQAYTRTLVVPKMTHENTSWMDDYVPSDLTRKIYVPDDPSAPLHPPKNKGHEVMIYLTYIIDHYDKLTDVTIFMHNHQTAWHNNDLAGNDAGEMLRRLSSGRVTRMGYMNLRCQWNPGCPDWIHPGEVDRNRTKVEESIMAKAWAEIFPFEAVPEVLAQPCCAQFALSRDRIRSIPLARFIHYRDWLMHTPLPDAISGRVWEYLWQYALAGEASHCPEEYACYCDGYGVCFGGKAQYLAWCGMRDEYNRNAYALRDWTMMAKKIEKAKEDGNLELLAMLDKPEVGKDLEYRDNMAVLAKQLDSELNLAKARGDDPKHRALEVGREWHEGDGF